MKKCIFCFSLLLFSIVVFNSCNTEEIPDPFPTELVKGCYIINYGSFGKGGASISKYNYETAEMTNFYYQSQNNGGELLSNIQYAYSYNDSIFLIGNVADQLITVNPLFKQTQNGVSNVFENPRFCVADGDFLYVSCLGSNPDWAIMPDSYLAKFNIKTNKIDAYFDLPGGPEGMAIARGKLYVALNYAAKIAVFDLATEQFSYIETPAVTSYFVKDAHDNLYATLLSTWANFSTDTGIGYINTSTNKLEATYLLPDVSSSYGSMIQTTSDLKKIYLVTSSYDVNWNLTGAVAEFNVASKSFGLTPFIGDISGISGIAVNPKDNSIYVFSAESTTGVGQMKVFSPSGSLINQFEVGAFPISAIFID